MKARCNALSECARIRQGSVAVPRKTNQQSNGDGTAPDST